MQTKFLKLTGICLSIVLLSPQAFTQSTVNSQQSTVNSQQSTVNSQQSTVNSIEHQNQEINFDGFGRLINYPNKIELPCPDQNEKTGVLLAIGQSNAANSGQQLFSTKYPDKVLNYFNGKCYIASSPLLGAMGVDGEFITPLADNLIDNGTYDSVIIISSAIGGSGINRWKEGGDLNTMMMSVMLKAVPHFKITEVIWHQGESDFATKTTKEEYIVSFNSLLNSLRINGTYMPPVYYAVATRCGGGPWTKNNPVAEAQRSLANEITQVYLGVDTDSLLSFEDRKVTDLCHFSSSGQVKTANAFANTISQHNAHYKSSIKLIRQ